MADKERNHRDVSRWESFPAMYFGIGLILILLAIRGIAFLIGLDPYVIFDPVQITVWAWVRDIYHLVSWAMLLICPGATIIILVLMVFNWATKEKTNGKD